MMSVVSVEEWWCLVYVLCIGLIFVVYSCDVVLGCVLVRSMGILCFGLYLLIFVAYVGVLVCEANLGLMVDTVHVRKGIVLIII